MVDPFLSVEQTRILHIMPQRQMRTAASAKNPAQALDLTAMEWCIPLPGPMKKSGKPADDGIFTAIARVPVQQCATEVLQMQNGAQAGSGRTEKYDKDMSTEEVREYIEERVKWGVEEGRKIGIELGLQEGLQKGLQQGVQQGRNESAFEIA